MPPASEPIAPYTALSAFVGDSTLVIQPADGKTGAATVDTLSIDLRTGSVQALQSAPQRTTPVPLCAVLGVCRLFKGYAVVVVTSAKVVATVLGADIFQVTTTRIVTSEEARTAWENRGLLKLLSDGVDPEGSGRGMYFSYFYDVTLSAQRTALIAQDGSAGMQTAAARADKSFFWNYHLSKPLIDAKADRFVIPAILGFVCQVPGLTFPSASGTKTASLTLIARRSIHRAGTRHWRRGADAEGNVANFAETEQIFQLDPEEGSSTPTVASFVQIRGSVPLVWSELPNMKYKPTRLIAPPEEQSQPFAKHINAIREQYKEVVAVSLVNLHGGEGKLAAAFETQAKAYTKTGGKDLHFVPFDFHKECGTKRYHRVSILWDQISGDFTRHGFFLYDPSGNMSKQRGVVRTNCIDCLDRTNVLQGILARKALDQVLIKLGLMREGASLPDAFPEIEQQFKVLWADHGDAISMQYAGTGAMKSGFTRTGKRSFGGIVDDGYKAVARYYLNNFQDGKKQDAIDLVTGAYCPEPGGSLPPSKQSSPLMPLLFVFIFLQLGIKQAAMAVKGQSDSGPLALLASVAIPLLTAGAILYATLMFGRFMVNKPQLCYPQAATVAKPKKA